VYINVGREGMEIEDEMWSLIGKFAKLMIENGGE